MNKMSFKSIRTRLIFWFLVIALIPLIISLFVSYNQQAVSIRSQEIQKLVAIRDLKVEQVNLWLKERIGDIRIIASDQEIIGLAASFTNPGDSFLSEKKLHDVKELLNGYLRNYGSYNEIFILNAETGIVEISTNKLYIGDNRSENEYYVETLRKKDIHIKDIHKSPVNQRPSMNFSIPIYLPGSKKISAILVTRVDLENSLYALLLNRSGMGETGETLIVNKDVYALNELRWYENAPLRLQISAEPAVNSSRGIEGTGTSVDYRGVPILTAYTYIPVTGWGFVAKEDLVEANIPLKLMLINFIVIFVISSLLVLAAAFFLAVSISKPLVEMTQVAEEIQRGTLEARNTISTSDEFSYLATAFNTMADSISSQLSIQKSEADLADIMVSSGSLEQFCAGITGTLMELSGSALGVFYLNNPKKGLYEPFYSRGADKELPSFDVESLEGQLGCIPDKKGPFYRTRLSRDTEFLHKTVLGTAVPAALVSLPIFIGQSVKGVITLASMQEFDNEFLTVAEHIGKALSTALSNILSAEETNKLAVQLKDKNEELKKQATELMRQSTELKKQNQELNVQKRQVMEANRLKSEFLSNMSHELRTPLNSVNALSKVLSIQAGTKLTEEENSFLSIIERNGKHLLQLINDILDLSKIEAGKLDILVEKFSLKQTIETVCESIAPLAENKNIPVKVQIPDDLPQIESEKSRVYQIIQNILGNAVKFTGDGYVQVSVSFLNSFFYIQIKDTGIGISPEALPHIFEEFRQADGSSSRNYEGTGLGLAIAHKSAGILGGSISVESIPGAGSTFTVKLPLTLPEEVTVKAGSFIPPSTSPVQPKQDKTVLVVDDDPEIAGIIAEYLTDEGYAAIIANSGDDALKAVRDQDIFAITLDVIMPGMDGFEVLQKLKANPDTAEIPVYLITISDDRETGFALGATGYITKPVEQDMLINELTRIHKKIPSKVLIVDDNKIDIMAAVGILEETGIEVRTAPDGKSCLEQIAEAKPDVLVLDLMMPGMDGFEVLDELHRHDDTRDLPVLIITSKELTPGDKERLSGKAANVLTKSTETTDHLLEEIKKAVKSYENLDRQKNTNLKFDVNTILLVEDNEAAAIQIRKIVESEGLTVQSALNGQEALDYLKDTIPGGIILDLMMPGVDGFEVLEHMKNNTVFSEIPVLILTAKDLTPADLSRLSAANVRHLIHKGDVNSKDLLYKLNQMIDRTEKDTPPALPKKKAAPVQLKKGESPRVLVIEDNKDNMITIRALLKDRCNLFEAVTGEEGLQKIKTEPIHMVLLDMSLPGMDGISVLEKIREEKEGENLPVIALTARAMKGDRENLIAAGCDDYLSKPIDQDVLYDIIDKWVIKT